MSAESIIKNSGRFVEKLTVRGRTYTESLFSICLLNGDHNAMKVHLRKHQVKQCTLDRCLIFGFQLVQHQHRELQHAAAAIKILIQFGAQWNDEELLDDEVIPLHLICQSAGDNNELLELILESSSQSLIDTKDRQQCTPLIYAIRHRNIRCVSCLINNGAAVNVQDDCSDLDDPFGCLTHTVSPLAEALGGQLSQHGYSANVMLRLIDVLLDGGADVDESITCAISSGNVECIKKLIHRGARLDAITYGDTYVWSMIAGMGDVELLVCILSNGIDKNTIDDNGRSLLWWVINSGKIDAIRFLLELGITLPKFQSEPNDSPCPQCGTTRIVLDERLQQIDPCMAAVQFDMPDVVQLLEQFGFQGFGCFRVLRQAVRGQCEKVVRYLFSKYDYAINIAYSTRNGGSFDLQHQTLLTETCISHSESMIGQLLDKGADPKLKTCEEFYPSALVSVISANHLEILARFIRRGVDVNLRSYDYHHGSVLPFEASVLHNNVHAAEMLLVTGCSCGVFNLEPDHRFKTNIKPELEDLMKEWNLQDNYVIPLEHQNRRAILSQLSPRVDVITKITGILPPKLVKFISMPELDDILVKALKSSTCHKNIN